MKKTKLRNMFLTITLACALSILAWRIIDLYIMQLTIKQYFLIEIVFTISVFLLTLAGSSLEKSTKQDSESVES